jgi:hypothetical protein
VSDKQTKEQKAKKELSKYKFCSSCGREYKGLLASLFFEERNPKKITRVRDVPICDKCFLAFRKRVQCWAIRQRKNNQATK